METGNLSIHSENIFPIIKKWLYSDHDIFIRELISNASDAITKLQKLVSLGEAPASDAPYRIDIALDKAAKTITISDNGIGMTADEIKQYINQIAFSGAEDFVKKYEGSTDADQIIGHFGLGFYSAFMVASRVEIRSLSYREGASPVHWVNEGGTEFTLSEGQRTARGTDVILHLSEEGEEFADPLRIRETIATYCSFMPHPIYFSPDASQRTDSDAAGDSDAEPTAETPLNNPQPLYLKAAGDVTDEEYRTFYRDTFRDFRDPLFQIHLNMDYPFRLKGILYFPKLGNQFELMDGQIKLYNAQVFVADNIKEVIPEFLMLLKGVIDCPDLPLNVSRSFLQNDGFVRKISGYISKKVSDKLMQLYRTEREKYEGFWPDIHPFIKFGAIRDDKFREAIKDALLFQTDKGAYQTIAELRASRPADAPIYYADDVGKQGQYIRMLNAEGIETIVLDQPIDTALISMLEQSEKTLRFLRVDAGIDASADGEESASAEGVSPALQALFAVPTRLKKFQNTEIPAVLTSDESTRRMGDMMRMYGMKEMAMPLEKRLVLNESSAVVQRLLARLSAQTDGGGSAQTGGEADTSSDGNSGAQADEDVKLTADYLYKLAQLSSDGLTPEEQTELVALSNRILLKLL